MAERKMRNGTAARWAAALNGAVNRSTVPERSLKNVLRAQGLHSDLASFDMRPSGASSG
jgi:hypothetical protein